MTKAWDKGYQAAFNGEGEATNPYDAETEPDTHSDWYVGWCDYMYQEL